MNETQQRQFNEIILWIGRPLFKPYLINQILSYQSSIRILLIGLIVSFWGTVLNNRTFNWNSFLFFISILFMAVFIQILLKIISYRNTKYWITKDALYIQTGVIRPTVVSIKKTKILHLDITKTNAEKEQNAGTIIIDDGEVKKEDCEEYKVYKKLIAIRNPEEVVRQF